MIEQNILNWLELGDSIQKIDVYNKKYNLLIFRYNYLLSKHGNLSEYFYIIIIILFFGQIWELNLEKAEFEDDFILEIISYLKKIFLFQKIIDNKTNFKNILLVSLIICWLYLLIGISNSILTVLNKNIDFLIFINSIINILTLYFINGPLIQILLYSLLCSNKTHIYSGEECTIDNFSFLFLIINCLIFAFLILILIIYFSFYINDIGCINGSNVKCMVNCNYTTIIMIIKVFYFILDYIISFKIKNDNKLIIIFYEVLFFIINFLISFYVYNNLHYYNNMINIFHHYGWYFSTWFSLCILLKSLLGIKDITLYVIFGLALIIFGFNFNNKYKEFKLITELNCLQGNSLKHIEVYNEILLNLLKSNSFKSRTLVGGVIKSFEEYLTSNAELYQHYHKFINDKHLQKKFSSLNELKILSMISIIYTYNIEKSKDVIDLTLNKCYFLINKYKNAALAIWLCTKIKTNTHIQSYYKYILMEEIKDYLIKKLTKNTNKISLKNNQISSVILYNQYVELFKIKIYEATCSQIEYFDTLRNSITNSKTTENFLKTAEDILALKKDIINLWEKIILLNPFNNESEKDYIIYLDTILQDNILKRAEIKRYNTLKAKKLPERNNPYYSMFIQDHSAVLLADGYSYNGKIIYASPNFPSLFMFTGKEILNTTIDDLLPDVIQTFHRHLIEDAIKYSNLLYIFKNQKNALLKGKNGLIFNIELYNKVSPNLSFGLIFFIYIQKCKDSAFIIILDENFIINGFTDINHIDSNFTMNNNYGLSKFINGYHIGLIIPEILLQMNYDVKTNTFNILKDNVDIKGYLYPINNMNELDDKVKKIIDIIKERKISELNDGNKFGAFEEYDDYIKELNTQYPKPNSIFFKIECHSFIGGKYKYYRVYITNDLLIGNENIIDYQSNENSIIDDENNKIKEKEKTKEHNEDSSFYNSSISQALNNKNSSFIKLKKKLNRQSKILIKRDFDVLNNEIKLINNKQNNVKEEDINNKDNSKLNNSYINKNIINLSQPSNSDSILNQSNIEPAEFNKLKNEIINKNDSFYIKVIKALSYIFIILTTLLIFYDYIYTKQVIDSTIEFLQENVFFTYSKIATACVYNSAFNIKLVKEEIIPNKNCPNLNCSLFYGNLLRKCVREVRIQKYYIFSFYQDYLDIFQRKLNADLYIYNRSFSEHLLNLDIDMFLNLIIGQGLKITANYTDYFNNDQTNNKDIEYLNIYIKNALQGSLKYFYSDYEGFSGKEKEKKCNKVTYNSPLRIIISSGYFFISSIIIFYLVCTKNYIEINFLDKLINFSSTNFDDYLKNLEELKKKFRDDSNDEDEKNMDELDMDVDEVEGKNDNKNENDQNYKRNLTSNENPKKKKNKQNKIQQQKLKKQKIMSDYFNKYNIYFGLKICIIFLLITSYFAITMITTQNMKKNFIEFDSTMEQINKVFFDSFHNFLIFKEQIQIFYRSKERSNLIIPSDTEVSNPKFGNSLMYILKNTKCTDESAEIMENLYIDDSCKILTNETNEYNYCANIFSSILTKGLEQAIIQMSIMITNVIDELNSLKKEKNLKDIYSGNSSYFNYEMFMGYYMLESFLLTQTIFDDFRNDEKQAIYKKNDIILFFYFIFYLIMIICLFCFIYSYKKTENSFLNFIGILPSKFIFDDESFYKAINKLGEYFY